ncbi:MAG: DUF2797 domain-containing protein [Candidatus Heimdallarchaeum endolithica]|uniref:DUF2797 domain-containing protein n=1 Tax=Candidatus Heimdallarchaeum endolithica TaxID=2876572 RepID=A0A9Y1BT07_9ARCH|nr:MAG: DUF2797 domain-containing protein [Candidatus Heimdallarchaeum endolithica]
MTQNIEYIEGIRNQYQVAKSELEEIFFPTVVTRYSVILGSGTTYHTYLIARNANLDYYRITLNGLIDLNFGKKVCLTCGKKINENETKTYCNNCTTEEEEKYKNCLFHSPFKYYNKKCTLEYQPCQVLGNREKCYSKYILYFGRFGEKIKVGISRFSYGKYKYKRIIEQGLNEAIVVYPFNSLPEVTFYERMLIDELGLAEKITFEEKVEALLNPTFIEIETYYPLKQIKELFYNKKLKKIDVYPDNLLENVVSSSFDITLKKNIKKLSGTIIFTQGNVGIIKKTNELTFFDISKLVGRELERRNEEW